MRYAVIIPVYNERATFQTLLDRLLQTPPPPSPTGGPCRREVIVVDDGSTDGTRDLVLALQGTPGLRVILHEHNRGKGAAVRTGFAAALAGPGPGPDTAAQIVLIQDADLEYDPADHAPSSAPILDGRADAVFGSRFLGETHRVLYYWHSVANRLITLLSNMATNLNLSDIECCLKAFRAEVLRLIDLEEHGFGIEPELVAKVAHARLPPLLLSSSPSDSGLGPRASGLPRKPRIFEVPVSYAGRTYEEGKKITWRDGFVAVLCIIKYNLMR